VKFVAEKRTSLLGSFPYAVSAAAFIASLSLSHAVHLWLGWPFMFPAVLGVLVIVAFAGTLVALASIPAFALVFALFFFAPVGSLRLADPGDWYRICVFVAVAVPVALVSGRFRRRCRAWQREAIERARSLARVEESEARFRRLTEHVPDIVYRYALRPEKRFEYVSPSCEDVTGYRSQEFCADPDLYLKALLPEDFRKLLGARAAATRATATPLALRWRTRDGKVIWMEQHDTVLRDRTGHAVAIEGVAREVTTRVEEEQARDRLLEEHRRCSAELKAVLDSMTTGVVIYDAEGRLRTMNKAAERLIPLSDSDRERQVRERVLLAVLKARFLDGRAISPEESSIARALRGEARDPVTVQLAPAEPDAPPRILSVSAAPVLDDAGETLGIVSTFADVTRLHQVQQQREDLLRAVAHDVRTPLQSILLNAAIIERRTGGPERARAAARSIIGNTTRMSAAINDVLETARLAAGELRARPEDVPLRGFVRDMARRLFLDRDLARVRVEVPEEARVRADPYHLERILTNLLTNALKYSPADAPVFVRAEQEGADVAIAVVDHGPGIPVEDQKRVFNRLFRGSSSGAKEGVGLGLYVARVLAEAQGGSVWLRSAPGAGSEFRVLLPKAKGPALTTISELSAQAAGVELEHGEERPRRQVAVEGVKGSNGAPAARPPDREPVRQRGEERVVSAVTPEARSDVLVVDDDADLRCALRNALEPEGYHVALAANGREAWERLQSEPLPALILLDLMMPVMNGAELLGLVRTDTRLRSVPVVLVSAFGSLARPVAAESQGFLAKPFDVEQILALASLYCSPRPPGPN
jgi:PAS domain S-box-containing protein